MDDTKEIWRPIEGYDGDYEVSNFGRVRSLKYGKVLILKLKHKRNGYVYVLLCKNNKQKAHYVHRLVAQAFIPNPDNLPQVNHKDECKTNNHVWNLEYCTQEYNCNYGTSRQRLSKLHTNHPNKSKPVLCVELNTIFPSIMEAQRQLGVNNTRISQCCNGTHWVKTAGGYHWKSV